MMSQNGLRILFLMGMLAFAVAEEEEKASDVSVGMAATLLGTVMFQMTMYYFLNHKDKDMRKHSYEVVVSTISIFCAVLLFQSVNDIFEDKFLKGRSPSTQIMFDFCHMLIWYATTQLSLAYISGAIGKKPTNLEEMECNMKCFAVLLAHITGFASINAFASVQQLGFFKQSPLHAFLVVPLAVIFQFSLQRITDTLRTKFALADGDMDEFEQGWDEETEEAENDVMGLVVSFTTVQAIRFAVNGTLPNTEGALPPEVLFSATGSQVFMLVGFGMLFLALLAVLVGSEKSEQEIEGENEADAESDELKDRLLETAAVVAIMGFAWCLFFSSRMFLAGYPDLQENMVLNLTIALSISFVSFACIRLLDIAQDADWSGEKVDSVIEKIIVAFGILVGFAWEQTFDTAVASLASRTSAPGEMKLVLAFFCVILIVPAWRYYMLPMVVQKGWMYGFVIQGHEHLHELAEGHKQLEEEEEKMKEEKAKKRQATNRASIQANMNQPLLKA